MSARGQATVGAFVLGGLLLALGAVIFFGKFNIFNPAIRAVIVFQDSIAGLSVGSPVTFRGVPIGSVESIAIQFDPRNNIALIPVIVRIEPERAKIERPSGTAGLDLPELIKRGLRAELNVQSFVTGQSQIDLDFDPGSEPVLHPDISTLPEIPTRQSTIQKAKEQLSQLPLRELADDATKTLASLRTLSEKLDKDLPPLVASLKTTSDQSVQMVQAATQAIKDLQARMDTTLAAVSRLSASTDTQMNQRGAELRTLLATTNQAMTQARDLLGEVRRATASRAPDRTNLDAALRDIAAAAASLRGFAGDIERNPQLLLTGRRP
ncbi:MlaD family protein [Rhodopila globiformis]|uniref:Paraquat-inducible protein B n=1 Tax=Rhodopila globiformis TaxID=1071 RepID=A0A2S6N5Q5_RHOGL|nr:MlaD family protein [Rhodopila globiformis]PPQ29944.1 paraquat-inducible protein B [Rhodopila globiformis]